MAHWNLATVFALLAAVPLFVYSVAGCSGDTRAENESMPTTDSIEADTEASDADDCGCYTALAQL